MSVEKFYFLDNKSDILRAKAMEIIIKKLSGQELVEGKEWITILDEYSFQVAWLDDGSYPSYPSFGVGNTVHIVDVEMNQLGIAVTVPNNQ